MGSYYFSCRDFYGISYRWYLCYGQLQQFEEWILSLDIMEVLKLTDVSISKKSFVRGKRLQKR